MRRPIEQGLRLAIGDGVCKRIAIDGTVRMPRRISLWIKIPYTAMVLVVVTFYWIELGPSNFLWFSDIALITLVPALWWESRFWISTMALAVLLPELAWNVDFAAGLLVGRTPIGLSAYMFKDEQPLWIRGLSLFHLTLPPVLLWGLYRLGYDRRALLVQTLLAWLVLPATYLLTGPEKNINWVYGPGSQPQRWLPPKVYLVLEMLIFPVCVYLPTHWVLRKLLARDS